MRRPFHSKLSALVSEGLCCFPMVFLAERVSCDLALSGLLPYLACKLIHESMSPNDTG